MAVWCVGSGRSVMRMYVCKVGGMLVAEERGGCRWLDVLTRDH